MAKRTTANPLGLDPQEGMAVTEIAVNVLGSNAALNEPLKVDMVLIEVMKNMTHGDVVHAVVELTKEGFAHRKAVDHEGTWKRVDQYRVTGAAVVASDVAEEEIHAQRVRVQEALDAAAGQPPLGDDVGPSATAA